MFSRLSRYSVLCDLLGCSPDGVDPICRIGCPFNGIGSALSDSVPMGHPGGASRLYPGLGSGPGGAAEVTPPEDVNSTGKQVSSNLSPVSVRRPIASWLAQAAKPKVWVLNSLRLSKTSPCATYHRASTSLRMMATMALPLRLPSRLILFWYQAPITRSR